MRRENPQMMTRDEQLRALRADVSKMVAESGDANGFDVDAWLGLWLEQPVPALGGRTPSVLLTEENGFDLVRSTLMRMQSGTYS